MRILYAAGNRIGSFFQMKRFLDSVKDKNYDIKIAAYKKSMGNIDIDYTLDCLLNFTNPDGGISFNGNYAYYNNEMKRFAPDLVISDMDIYTSILATEANIRLWQFSPMCLYYGLNHEVKYNVGIHKNYAHLFGSNNRKADYINNILNNSNRKFVPSHLCDTDKNNILAEGYEWVRPNFLLGDMTNKTDYLAVLPKMNRKVIHELKDRNAFLLSAFTYELYDGMRVESLYNEDVYRSVLANCKHFISDGTAVFLADAFYNEKYCLSNVRVDDIESIVCSQLNEYAGVGETANNLATTKPIDIKLNDGVKFISEHLDQI